MNIEDESTVEINVLESQLTDAIDSNDHLMNNIGSNYDSGRGYNEFELNGENDIDINLRLGQDQSNEVLGMEFKTPNEAYTFYNRYAFLHGFGIRIHWDHKNRTTNVAYRKQYVCNKEGFKKLNNKGSNGNDKKRRRDSRTGCKAMLRIMKKKDESWFVDYFNDVHNHPLINTPSKVMKHHSHAKFHRSMACKSLMSELGQSGLRPSQIKKVVNVMKDPSEVDVTAKQCSDILSEQRKIYKGKEFYGLIKHFHDKAKSDSKQYLAVDLFDDRSPRNIFWADGRSRDSYLMFSDVVVFDVTYMTNKFKMPFAPFVVVNHHGQSILFGAALLENEKEETFVWLFENFLSCMFNKHPSAIITDQDKAMGNAIHKVFPNTRHRYCAWHIKKHELEHLQPLRARYSDFHEFYMRWVKSNTIEEFETQWEYIRDKFDIKNGDWLMNMYNLRKHRAKVYLKDIFFAGMTTSGRSESIHAFFDGFVNSRTMLNEFVVQYDKALDSRRNAEEDEDFKTMNTNAVLSTIDPIEAKAGECYTRKMFEVFKKEWIEANNNVRHEKMSKTSDLIRYKVGLLNVDKEHWRIVDFHLSGSFSATCSCAKFETYGILCKHILYVMKRKDVMTLPDKYILSRWTMNARHKMKNASIELEGISGEQKVSPMALWCVQSICTKAIEEASDSPLEIKKFHSLVMKFLEEQMQRKKVNESVLSSAQQDSRVRVSQVDMMPHISIRDPSGVTNTKGRPKHATRIKSPVEVNMNAREKKKKACSHCHELGHYITGCPKKKLEKANSINEM